MKADSVAAHRALTLAVAIALIVQFMLGMITNLYVTIPHSHPGAKAHNYFSGLVHGLAWATAHGAASLAAHTLLGLILAISTVALVVLSVRSRQPKRIAPALIGAAFTIGAGFNGASFLNYGHDLSSMLMATFFAVALVAYITALYLETARAPILNKRTSAPMPTR